MESAASVSRNELLEMAYPCEQHNPTIQAMAAGGEPGTANMRKQAMEVSAHRPCRLAPPRGLVHLKARGVL